MILLSTQTAFAGQGQDGLVARCLSMLLNIGSNNPTPSRPLVKSDPSRTNPDVAMAEALAHTSELLDGHLIALKLGETHIGTLRIQSEGQIVFEDIRDNTGGTVRQTKFSRNTKLAPLLEGPFLGSVSLRYFDWRMQNILNPEQARLFKIATDSYDRNHNTRPMPTFQLKMERLAAGLYTPRVTFTSGAPSTDFELTSAQSTELFLRYYLHLTLTASVAAI